MFQKKALIVGNMKVLSLILLGACALGIVTFKCVTSLPRVKTTPAPFNWQQYLPPDYIAPGKSQNYYLLLLLYCDKLDKLF